MLGLPAILNAHTPSSSFAIIHSPTQESLATLFDKLSRKVHAEYHGERVGPGWLKYDYDSTIWNLDDESDYAIFVWRQSQNQSPSSAHAPSPHQGSSSHSRPQEYASSQHMDPPAPGLFIGSGHSAPRSPLVRNNEHNMGAIVAAPTPTLYLHNPGQSLPELSPRVNRAYYLYHPSRMSTAKQAEKKGVSDDGRSRGTLSIDAEHQHPYISHDLPQYRGDDGGKGKQAARQQPNLDYEVEKANGSISEIGIGESALMRRKTARSEASRKRQEELKMNFDKFHGENGVRTVIGNIGPVQNVRMLLKSGYRHVYVSRKFAIKHGFIPKDAIPGQYGYGGLVSIGVWPISVLPVGKVHHSRHEGYASPSIIQSPKTTTIFMPNSRPHSPAHISHSAPRHENRALGYQQSTMSMSIGRNRHSQSFYLPSQYHSADSSGTKPIPDNVSGMGPRASGELDADQTTSHRTSTPINEFHHPLPRHHSYNQSPPRPILVHTPPPPPLTTTMLTIYLSEEPHFDVVLGRSFFEKRQIKVDAADPTEVLCLDNGEKLECELVILKDGKGEFVTVT